MNEYEILARQGLQKLANQDLTLEEKQQLEELENMDLNDLTLEQKERLKRIKDIKKKQSAAQIENIYQDGLNKIAQVTGVNPETLDEKIAEIQEENEITDEEANEILKQAAQESPEMRARIGQIEEEEENAELNRLMQAVDKLSEEEAEELLAKARGE